MTEQVVEVEILQDPNPEPEESLTVVLASPKNGLLLGEPHKGVDTFTSHAFLRILINPCPVELFVVIFRPLKLELLTQYPSSNDGKYFVI